MQKISFSRSKNNQNVFFLDAKIFSKFEMSKTFQFKI